MSTGLRDGTEAGRLIRTGWRRFARVPDLSVIRLARGPAGRRRPGARRPRRPTRRGVLIGAVLLVVAAIAVGVMLFATPLASVRTVDVTGARRVSAQRVLAAADVAPGRPLARLDPAAIAERVARLPEVASVTVSRAWPSGVHIEVHERAPVAYTRRAGSLVLLDRAGAAFARVRTAPPQLPKVDPAVTAPAAVQAAVTVAAGLPPAVRAATIQVSAATPDDVRLALTGGRTVIWGAATDDVAKAQVLRALLRRQGSTYDVSGMPTVVVR